MLKDQMREKRAEKQALLDQYESGKVTHYDEDERGELERDVTPERIADLKQQIAELDRKLAEDWRDA